MTYPLQNALFQWEEGQRELERFSDDPRAYRQALRVIDAVHEELRRRIGPTFRAEDLAALHSRGTDWCLAVAVASNPPSGADPQSLADAAFASYLRKAVDFAGGREINA